MALLTDGSWLGTIGGGHVEQMAQQRCAKVLSGDEDDTLEWLTHAKTGMACGGDALVGVALWRPESADVLSKLQQLLSSDTSAWILECWPKGYPFKLSLASSPDSHQDFAPLLCDTIVWDEDTRRYAEPIGPDPVAYIFGGGHVGRALTPVLASVGFRVVVFDDRPGSVNPDDFPAAERVVFGNFKDIKKQVSVGPRDYVVVLTHGHAADIDVLEQVYAGRPAYVGCIGSRAKAAFARKTLTQRGIPQDWSESIRLPIGEEILAVTPAEIAISIAAEMIRCRAQFRARLPHEKGGSAV
jgi:xanthine dehydrogenase accessory factor